MIAPMRKKSPRAPSVALDDAIEKTAKAYARDRLHAAPTDVVAQHLGYKSANNGAALQALASLRYYGLMERPSEGMMAVSKSYESYQYAPDDELRRRLSVRWLETPPVFAELLTKYANGLPSDATLRHELITERGFIPSAAETLIAVLKRSVDFVGYFDHEQNQVEESDAALSEEDAHVVPPSLAPPEGRTQPSLPATRQQATEPLSIHGAGDLDQIPIRLSGGRRVWLVVPTPFFEADKARIKAHVDLLLTDDEEFTHSD